MPSSISYSEVFKAIANGFQEIVNNADEFKGINLSQGEKFLSETNLKKVLREKTKVEKESKPLKTEVEFENTYESKKANIKNKENFDKKDQKSNKLSLDFNKENLKMGVIYSEILGEPKCKRRRRG